QGNENPDDQMGGDVFYQNAADDPENARSAPVSPASGSSHSQLSNAELVAAASAGGALPAAGVFQDGAGSQRGPAGARPNFGQQVAPIVSAATPVPAGVIAGSASVIVPDLWPPVTRAESDGGDGALPSDGATDAE